MVNFNIFLQAARQSCVCVDNFGFSAHYFANIVPVVSFSSPQCECFRETQTCMEANSKLDIKYSKSPF